jgi:hypothetical protein
MSGWIGDRSVPTTRDEGNKSPISMAQSPTPVAMSRMNCGGSDLESGAK